MALLAAKLAAVEVCGGPRTPPYTVRRDECGIPNREARLLGGEYLRGHELPWAGLIQVKDGRSMPATLINDRFVVTSATNVLGLTPLDIKVTIGQFDRCFPDVSSTNMSVEKIVVHPDFSPADRAHDIALLKFSTPVKIERRVSPICLATPNTKYLGQVATVSAWFETETEQGPASASCRPRKLGLPVLGKTECINSLEDPQIVSNDKGCIGVVGLPSPICRVDSGGPVMFRTRQGVYELVGVLTDRNECNLKPGVALYTYINDHLPWITQNTKDACYCFKT
ncbi:vitamin K-dependent protein C-like [Anoplophora glabripennis]|uniref:vitamin K-dependent protein C-like n=1 Tax=Anoplophora glabripennis TaxID=217634 RepID=UPI000C78F687|nr:vitamin K-dependent protein C-like [Anoplophora glabripennis]